MKSFLRTLVVWLVLLAVPFAGFARAATCCCPPGTGHATQHTQPAMHHHDGGQLHGCPKHHGTQDHTSKHDAKCANCAACCTAAVQAPLAFAPPPALPPQAGHAITVDAGHVPSVHLDHPERPPRFTRA